MQSKNETKTGSRRTMVKTFPSPAMCQLLKPWQVPHDGERRGGVAGQLDDLSEKFCDDYAITVTVLSINRIATDSSVN